MKKLFLILLLILSAWGTKLNQVKIWDGTETVKVTTDSSIQVKIGSGDTIQIWDGTNLFKTDGVTNAMRTIDYPHHELHSGNNFYIKDYVVLANQDSLLILFVVPDTTKWPHAVFGVESETGEALLRLHRGVTVSDSGTGCTIFNSNENSATAPAVKCYTGPTISSYGTTLQRHAMGAGNKSGGETRSLVEIIGKQNTMYLIVIDNNTALNNTIDYQFVWYEHTNLQ